MSQHATHLFDVLTTTTALSTLESDGKPLSAETPDRGFGRKRACVEIVYSPHVRATQTRHLAALNICLF
jgi:hypothetical protein